MGIHMYRVELGKDEYYIYSVSNIYIVYIITKAAADELKHRTPRLLLFLRCKMCGTSITAKVGGVTQFYSIQNWLITNIKVYWSNVKVRDDQQKYQKCRTKLKKEYALMT